MLRSFPSEAREPFDAESKLNVPDFRIGQCKEAGMQVGQKTYIGDISRAPALPFARYRLRFKPSRKGRLPGYTGSAWRGVLGHALKKIVCVTHLNSCPPCLLYRSCPYPYIFETPPPVAAQKMCKYTAAPHPFVLEPPQKEKKSYAKK